MLACNQVASMVQWLGFYPSKVEVGVRFTVVATDIIFFFEHLFFLASILILHQFLSQIPIYINFS